MSIATEISKPTATAFDDATASLISQLKTRAPAYFPQLDARTLKMRLVQESRRTYSALHEFELSDGTRSHAIIVKTPFLPSRSSDAADAGSVEPQRPRLFGLVDPRHMAEFEFRSLRAIQQHLEKVGDPRLGAIEPLELLHHPTSVVMAKHDGASLRQIHLAARRIRLGASRIPFSPDDAIQNAGIWLREYHRIAPLPQTTDRMTTRVDFCASLAEQTGHLIDQGENKVFLGALQSQLAQHAQRVLPAQLELATGHGDFAPRNLLIGRDNKVTALDTLARWRAPIFEDVASFLIGLRSPAAQVVSFGLAYDAKTIDRFASHFLTYYFDGGPVPFATIRLFEGLLLLDRWSAFVQRAKLARGTRKLYVTWRLTTLRRFLFQYFRKTLRELEQLG